MKKEVKKSLLNSMFSSRKATFVSLTVFLSVLLIVGVLLFFFWDRQKEPVDGIYYYPADYSADIFQNVAYTTFTRDLLYGAGGVEQLFNYEMDLESSSAECKFFLRYFHSVIYGEYEKIGEFYVDGFFEEKPKFTMQMVYDPYVLYHSAIKETIDGKEETIYNFHVRYRIFKNNGTFRKGVASGEAVPQIYQLIKDAEGNYRIYRILEIEFKDVD